MDKSTHTKTARPANVGPHDRSEDQHDPNQGKRDLGKAYQVKAGDNVSDAPAEGPVQIPVKGGSVKDGPAPKGETGGGEDGA